MGLIPGGYSFGFLLNNSGGGGGGSVISVTGNIVDNTDPNNPVVTQIFEVFTESLTQTGGTNDFTFTDSLLVTYRQSAVYRYKIPTLSISLDTSVRIKANSLAFITVKDQDGSTDLPISYFQQGKYYDFVYNGTNFVLVTTINEAIPVTYTGAQTLITGNNLIPNIDYFITDRLDAGLKLRAETNSAFGVAGSGGYMNADYQDVGDYSSVSGFVSQLGIWNAGLTPVVGDVVINYGNHYKNTTGVNTSTQPILDPTNWSVLSRSTSLNNGYITEWDDVIYDFSADHVIRRSDKRRNVVEYTISKTADRFQWGSDNCTFNKIINNATAFLVNNTGTIKYNTVDGQNSIINAIDNSGTITSNVISGNSTLNANTNSGIITANMLKSHGTITATSNTGQIVNNTIESDSVITATTNAGTCSVNVVSSGATINVTSADVASIVQNNYLFGTATILHSETNAGDIEQCYFIGINITINLPGTNFRGCYLFGENATTITIDGSATILNKWFVYNVESTFECTIDISGLTTLDILAGNKYCGVVNVTSSNATESLTNITNIPLVPFTVVPENGLTVTFVSSAPPPAIVATEIYLPEATIAISGTLRYWIKFKKDTLGVGYSAYVYHLPPLTGSTIPLTNTEVAFGSSSNFMTSSPNLFYNSSAKILYSTAGAHQAGFIASSDTGVVAGFGMATQVSGSPVLRWAIFANGDPETGADAGRNLIIRRYDDSGTFVVENVIKIYRDTGEIEVPNLQTGTIGLSKMVVSTGLFGLLSVVDLPPLSPISLTYAAAATLVGGSDVIVGQLYIITDATINDISLMIMGTSSTTFSVEAQDAAFPTDVVYYDFNNDLVTWRWDTVLDISSYEDWRNGSPACAIGTGCSVVHIGQSSAGIVPNDTISLICGQSVTLDLTGAATAINNATISSGCVLSDSGFDVTIDKLVMQDNSVITATDSACTTISAVSVGISVSLSTAHVISSLNIGSSSTITFTDNTVSSVRSSAGIHCSITAAGLVSSTLGDDLTVNTLQLMSGGSYLNGISTFVFDVDIDSISSNVFDFTFGATDDISWVGIINFISGTGNKQVDKLNGAIAGLVYRFQISSSANNTVTFHPVALASVADSKEITADVVADKVLVNEGDFVQTRQTSISNYLFATGIQA